MYGREKIAVVKPTNAVSATKNTLKESTKKSLPATSIGPSLITRTVNAIDASQVRRLTATLTRDAQARWPIAARSSAPASGKTSTATVSGIRLLALSELFEMFQVEAVELFADLEEEHAEDQHAHQHVERDAQLDDHRHAVSRAGRGEEQAVFHRQEADHLWDRLAPSDHHQERQQHARHRDAQRAARDRARELRDRHREVEREHDEHDAHDHRRRHVDQALEFPPHVELVDEPVQQPREHEDLEQQGEGC